MTFSMHDIFSNTIVINGKRYEVTGKNISIKNNTVYVDGKKIVDELHEDINIRFDGELANLKCDSNITVNGMVHGDVDAGGNISCGAVDGDVDAGGNVVCGVVAGDVDAGGNVTVGKW